MHKSLGLRLDNSNLRLDKSSPMRYDDPVGMKLDTPANMRLSKPVTSSEMLQKVSASSDGDSRIPIRDGTSKHVIVKGMINFLRVSLLYRIYLNLKQFFLKCKGSSIFVFFIL